MRHEDSTPMRVRWARLRFSIIGPLLASPPLSGELAERLRALAEKSYQHPNTRLTIRFGASTIERWFYDAKDEVDPIVALERKVASHAGTHPAISAAMAQAIAKLYEQHPGWTCQLHHDNLEILARENPLLGPMPSYTTVRRYRHDQGFTRQKKRRHRHAELESAAAGGANEPAPFVRREVRSYEMTHVHSLWHLDFHDCSRRVLTASGEWKTPHLLGVLDDYSRLCCHLQWYLDETADSLCHGLSQALLKRGLPRALMTDNGSAMIAAETTEGLTRLGILHKTTLPYSPEQNAKQECFWAQVEGRLMAMLEGQPELTLPLLNEATQAWVEQEYQRRQHSEIGEAPVERALRGPSVGRPCVSSDALRRAFRTETTRAQRRSDGTITVEGVRFEIPGRYRTLVRVTVRVARWDLSSIDLCDPRTGAHLCTLLPLDKHGNSDGHRRPVAGGEQLGGAAPPPSGIAPRLRALMADYAATGLPPAYLPKDQTTHSPPDEEDDQ